MDTNSKFYVLTEQELRTILREQRKNCATMAKEYPYGVVSAPEPPLPKMLDEWLIINKITSKQK